MKVEPKTRQLTDPEKVIQAEYKLKQWQVLLSLVAKDIGKDKLIEIAKSEQYPKNDAQIEAMIEQGNSLRDLDRYEKDFEADWFHKEEYGEWVKWEDIEKIIIYI